MSISEATKKWQKLSKRLMFIGFALAVVVCVVTFIVLGVSLNNSNSNHTAAVVVACVVVTAAVCALFALYFILNKINLKHVEEAKAAEEQANKVKSEFLMNMSHDIRTPMNSIMGMTTIAIANIDNKEQVADCLKKISLSSRHLLGLINDVLDMSKIESGKMTLNMEQLSLSDVIEGISTIIQPQIRTKKQKFDIIVRDITSENVFCDGGRLNQVLLNLLSNAYKFTPEGGTIDLSIYQEVSPRGEDFVRTNIVVQDNGPGMSEEFRQHIFDTFAREDSARLNKTEGTGLGLAITKFIIDAMQGSIDVQSKKGEGTKFHVVLDLEKAQAADGDMTLPAWKMLVVDDDQTLCETTISSLSAIGVNAESVLDGETAIKKAVAAQDDENGYDVIMLDWKLPGIDGIETARRLRKKLTKDIPIVLVSAYDWSEIEDEAREAGVSAFIPKPLFKSTLFHGLRQFADGYKGISLEGKRLLVAEDNDLNWEIANLLLSGEGFVLEHAEDGQVCVDMLLAHKADYYDAILMDVRMPVMDGFEATAVIRNLKRGYNKVPIIAMTADAFAEDAQKCIESGMNAHIAKPIDVDVVKATLARHIRR